MSTLHPSPVFYILLAQDHNTCATCNGSPLDAARDALEEAKAVVLHDLLDLLSKSISNQRKLSISRDSDSSPSSL